MHRSHPGARRRARRAHRGGRFEGEAPKRAEWPSETRIVLHAKRIGVPKTVAGCSRPWTRLIWCAPRTSGALRLGWLPSNLAQFLAQPLEARLAHPLPLGPKPGVRHLAESRRRSRVGPGQEARWIGWRRRPVERDTGRARPPDACYTKGARSRWAAIRTYRRYQGGRTQMPVGMRAGTPKG